MSALSGKRSRTSKTSVSGGTGGSGVATVAVGPTFGPSPATASGVTAAGRTALTMPALALSGLLIPRSALTMPSLALNGSPQVAQPKLNATALGAPFWQSVNTNTIVTTTNVLTCIFPVVVKAGSTGIGDLLIMVVNTSNVVATGQAIPNTPTGWTASPNTAIGFSGNVAALRQHVYWRIQDGTEGGSATVTFNQNAGQATIEIHRVIGQTAIQLRLLPLLVSSPWGGAFGNAHLFDGVARGVGLSMSWDCGTPAVAGNFCLEAKVRTPAVVDVALIAGRATGINGPGESQPFITIDSGKHFIGQVGESPSGISKGIQGTTVLTANTNYDVAVNYDGTTMRLFVNGVLDGSRLITGVEAPSAAVHFKIGNFSTPTANYAPFAGVIDEVRLSSASRYIANYTPAAAPFTTDASTVGLWHLDSLVYPTPDSSGNGFDGTAPPGPTPAIPAGYDPINVASNAGLNATDLVTSPNAPSVTTTVVNTLVFSALNHYHAALTNVHSPPTNFDERTDFECNLTAILDASHTFTKVFAASGATGQMLHTCTETVATDACMVTFAITPGVATLL